MKKALLKVGYSCNSNCVFCHSRRLRRYPDLSTSRLKERIGAAGRRGAGMVVFSGGEPTIRPDLPELAAHASSLGLRSGLITNGRRFVYPAFGEQLRARGLDYVYMSFHSHRAEEHDRTTRTSSFRQTVAALRNLSGLGLDLTVNVVVTRGNIGDLDAVVDLLARFEPSRIKLSAVEPKGACLDEPSIVPPLSESAAMISRALAAGRARHPAQRFACEGLTPCLLEGFDELNDDLIASGFALFQEAFEDGFSPPDRLNRSKAPACWDCSRLEDCPGVFSGYLAGPERAPLEPLLRRRSNAFVFVPDGRALPVPRRAAACPARGEDPRRIYIADGGALRRWRTPTRDFSEAEIGRIRGLGQVYLSARGRHTRLDYGRDLVKLEVCGLCGRCPERSGCSRLYRPTARKVFAGLESRVRALVREARGDVLEVGCGDVRFRAVVEASARAGRIRYLGIDPELPGERREPGLVLRRCGVEEFSAPDASFDRILLLRSYNHLRRPSEVFPRLRRMLRPDGRLVVVDGAAFGLAVPRRPAEAAPGAFHHYRNHTSLEARGLLEAAGFRALREVPVAPGGGTEWLLELSKA